jgi:hypothetical protein
MSMSDRDKEAWHRLGKVDAQEAVLALYLGNWATYAQWRDEMFRVMPPKTDRRTGEMKPGISERTFDRRLKVIIERGHTVRPDDFEGGYYSIIAGPWAAGEDGYGSDTINRQSDLGTCQSPSPLPSPAASARPDSLIAQALRHMKD